MSATDQPATAPVTETTESDLDRPHILVVDDDERLRDLLARFLRERGFLVTTAVDAADARAKLDGFAFDILVIDVMMPGESGLELTQSLRETSDVPILLLTAMDGAEDRIVGLENGADDYLTKPFEPRELVARLNSILRRAGHAPGRPRVIRFGTCAFDPARGELRREGRLVRLTPGEASLLEILASRPNTAYSREELSEKSNTRGGDRAIDVQIARLRRKIEADPRMPRYLQTVRGAGYVLRTD